MRRRTIGTLVACAVLAGCGGGATFANKPRPATPVNITVYLNDSRVSVSPNSVGAGPVVFIVTNQASTSESLAVQSAGGSTAQPLADTGPISPQATAQVTVNFSAPGDYTISAGKGGATDASIATQTGIQSATLHIGAPRPSGSNALLQP
jgi:hypothetical protein